MRQFEPGHYSPSHTRESFPLYVPPGVTLLGARAGESLIDGEGAMDLSFRPVREGQSLVLLGDQSMLSGFTLMNSGGNGVANQPEYPQQRGSGHWGAARRNRARVLLSRNRVEGAGEIPILLQGGAAETREEVIANIVLAQMTQNALPHLAGTEPLVLNDGLLDNVVQIEEPVPAHQRLHQALPYEP